MTKGRMKLWRDSNCSLFFKKTSNKTMLFVN